MTRQDYILIADALVFARQNSIRPIGDSLSYINGVLRAAEEISERLAFENPKFDREHFLAVVRGDKAFHSRPAKNGVRS